MEPVGTWLFLIRTLETYVLYAVHNNNNKLKFVKGTDIINIFSSYEGKKKVKFAIVNETTWYFKKYKKRLLDAGFACI